MEVVHDNRKLGLDLSKKIYECSCCGKLFNWSEDSEWFGSLRDMEDNPKKLKFSCSPKCKQELELTFKADPIKPSRKKGNKYNGEKVELLTRKKA